MEEETCGVQQDMGAPHSLQPPVKATAAEALGCLPGPSSVRRAERGGPESRCRWSLGAGEGVRGASLLFCPK